MERISIRVPAKADMVDVADAEPGCVQAISNRTAGKIASGLLDPNEALFLGEGGEFAVLKQAGGWVTKILLVYEP